MHLGLPLDGVVSIVRIRTTSFAQTHPPRRAFGSDSQNYKLIGNRAPPPPAEIITFGHAPVTSYAPCASLLCQSGAQEHLYTSWGIFCSNVRPESAVAIRTRWPENGCVHFPVRQAVVA